MRLKIFTQSPRTIHACGVEDIDAMRRELNFAGSYVSVPSGSFLRGFCVLWVVFVVGHTYITHIVRRQPCVVCRQSSGYHSFVACCLSVSLCRDIDGRHGHANSVSSTRKGNVISIFVGQLGSGSDMSPTRGCQMSDWSCVVGDAQINSTYLLYFY